MTTENHWHRAVFDKLFEANIDDANELDEDQPNIAFQISGEDGTNELLLFDAFEIIPVAAKSGQQKPKTKLRGGAVFVYKYIGNNEELREYLKKLEIGADNKKLSCFAYAPAQLGTIDQDILRKINPRCFGSFPTQIDAVEICDEFDLDPQGTIYDESCNSDIRKKAWFNDLPS
jgi:hypothetical protein